MDGADCGADISTVQAANVALCNQVPPIIGCSTQNLLAHKFSAQSPHCFPARLSDIASSMDGGTRPVFVAGCLVVATLRGRVSSSNHNHLQLSK
eukprot:scaffold164464_cov17-Tisochrysis_lutea.AAC.1